MGGLWHCFSHTTPHFCWLNPSSSAEISATSMATVGFYFGGFSLSLSLHRLLKEFSRAKGLPTSFFMCFYWWLCFLNPTWFVSPILNPTFFSCVSIPQLGRLVVAVVPEGQARREPLAFRPGPESRHVAVDLWGFTNIKGQTLGFNQQKWCLNQPKPWIQPAKRTQHRDLTTT